MTFFLYGNDSARTERVCACMFQTLYQKLNKNRKYPPILAIGSCWCEMKHGQPNGFQVTTLHKFSVQKLHVWDTLFSHPKNFSVTHSVAFFCVCCSSNFPGAKTHTREHHGKNKLIPFCLSSFGAVDPLISPAFRNHLVHTILLYNRNTVNCVSPLPFFLVRTNKLHFPCHRFSGNERFHVILMMTFYS